MGKSTISMTIFNCYLSSPEGKREPSRPLFRFLVPTWPGFGGIRRMRLFWGLAFPGCWLHNFSVRDRNSLRPTVTENPSSIKINQNIPIRIHEIPRTTKYPDDLSIPVDPGPRSRREGSTGGGLDGPPEKGGFHKWVDHVAVCQNLVPLVNIKIAGKWMFIPLKMVLIGIDPYPCGKFQSLNLQCLMVYTGHVW